MWSSHSMVRSTGSIGFTPLLLMRNQLRSGIQGNKEYVRSRLSKRHDLVTACYVLSEIEDASQWRRVVESLWQTTGDTLLIAEPGTPIGSAIVREARWQVCAPQMFHVHVKSFIPCPVQLVMFLEPCPIQRNHCLELVRLCASSQRCSLLSLNRQYQGQQAIIAIVFMPLTSCCQSHDDLFASLISALGALCNLTKFAGRFIQCIQEISLSSTMQDTRQDTGHTRRLFC